MKTEADRHLDVYDFAAHIGRRLGCTHVACIGPRRAEDVARLRHHGFKVFGFDGGGGLESRGSAEADRMDRNQGFGAPHPIPREIITRSVIVCSAAVEPGDGAPILGNLKQLMDYAPAGIVWSIEGEPPAGEHQTDLRPTRTHVGEQKLGKLRTLLEQAGLRIEFSGGVGRDATTQRGRSVVVLANNHAPVIARAPSQFRVVAIICAYNEEDVIVPSLRNLIDQGIEVYLIDNWSTDRTVERAQALLGCGVLDIERFPPEGPPKTFQLARLLDRTEEVSVSLEADWFMHVDADELRESPWENVPLKDALYHVDRLGFNAVDHTLLWFPPADDGYPEGADMEGYFRLFEFDFESLYRGASPFDSYQANQLNVWKNTGVRVVLAAGGHEVVFAGRRTYPYNFLIRHFPFRSQRHAEKKVFTERKQRFDTAERAAGWHIHYDAMAPGHNFLRDPSALRHFDRSEFYERYLVERLASIGPGGDMEAAEPAGHERRLVWLRRARRLRRRLLLGTRSAFGFDRRPMPSRTNR
jgi:glycosyltransferase involved in cell wall biosynthesis